jgi:hypothetical protein
MADDVVLDRDEGAELQVQPSAVQGLRLLLALRHLGRQRPCRCAVAVPAPALLVALAFSSARFARLPVCSPSPQSLSPKKIVYARYRSRIHIS